MGKAITINDLTFSTNIGTVNIIGSEAIDVTNISITNKPTSIINSVQLIISVLPSNATNKAVTWSSSNTSIATVNSTGLVTVIAAGTVTITATSQADSSISDSANIICSLSNIAVTSIDVTGLNSGIVGDNIQLTASVLPSNATNKSVTWSSSNTSVATVNSSGLVTIISAGTVIITATSQADNTKSDSITIQCSNGSSTELPSAGMIMHLSAAGKTTSDTSTTWDDLSGNNNNFSLSGFLMDGLDGWANDQLIYSSESVGVIKSSSNQIIDGGLGGGTDGEVTLFIRAKRSLNTGMYRLFYPNVEAGDSYNYSLKVVASGVSVLCGGVGNIHLVSIPDNTYFTAGLRISGNVLTVYYNNQHTTYTDVSIDRSNVAQPIAIGSFLSKWNTVGERLVGGGIKSVLLYDRALADEEITQIINSLT